MSRRWIRIISYALLNKRWGVQLCDQEPLITAQMPLLLCKYCVQIDALNFVIELSCRLLHSSSKTNCPLYLDFFGIMSILLQGYFDKFNRILTRFRENPRLIPQRSLITNFKTEKCSTVAIRTFDLQGQLYVVLTGGHYRVFPPDQEKSYRNKQWKLMLTRLYPRFAWRNRESQ